MPARIKSAATETAFHFRLKLEVEKRGYECWAYDGPCLSLHSSASRSGTYAELLFVDCCLAFNTVLSSRLNDKLLNLEAEQSFSQEVGGGSSVKSQTTILD